jgi:hypothetical protein
MGVGNSIYENIERKAFYGGCALLIGVLLSALIIAWLSPIPRTVEAQSIGTVQLAVRPQTLNFTSTSTNQVINLGSVSQVGEMITLAWDVAFGDNDTICHALLLGSNAGPQSGGQIVGAAIFWNASAGNPAPQQIIYGNGYFPFLWLVLNPEGYSQCNVSNGGLTALTVYVNGIATAIPINNTSFSWDATGVLNGATPIGPASFIARFASGPYNWTGIQCANSGGSAAFIQLFDNDVAPTLGTTVPFYTAMVPSSSTWSYSGPPMHNTPFAGIVGESHVYGYPYIAATTTRTGGTTASNVSCDVQLNYAGPFYPMEQ